MTGNPAVVVSARGISHEYRSGRTGIDALDVEVRSGVTVVLLGPNGSGKTTLLRLLAGDLEPSGGRVTHACASTRSELRSGIGYAPDSAAQLDELTGRENARLFARAFGAGDDDADRLLSRFGLDSDADVAVAEYSFGMRRKLALVQVLAHSPALLLLDEPTIGLDPAAITILRDVLGERAAAGAAVVIATNDTRTATMADHVVFLHRGRAVSSGTPGDLLRSVEGVTRIEVELEAGPAGVPRLPEGITSAPTGKGLVLSATDGTARLPEICEALAAAGQRIRRIDVNEPGFAEVFRKLTGEDLGADGPLTGPASAGRPDAPLDTGGDGRNAGRVRRPRRSPPWRRGE